MGCIRVKQPPRYPEFGTGPQRKMWCSQWRRPWEAQHRCGCCVSRPTSCLGLEPGADGVVGRTMRPWEAAWLHYICLVAQSCPTLCNPMDCSPQGSSVHGDSPGQNTGVGCHALLQVIFPTQGSNPRSPALQVDSSPSEPPGKSNQHQAQRLWF